MVEGTSSDSFHFIRGALRPQCVIDQDFTFFSEAFTGSIVRCHGVLVDLDSFTSRIWQSNLISSGYSQAGIDPAQVGASLVFPGRPIALGSEGMGGRDGVGDKHVPC